MTTFAKVLLTWFAISVCVGLFSPLPGYVSSLMILAGFVVAWGYPAWCTRKGQ